MNTTVKPPPADITDLLARAGADHGPSLGAVMPLVYTELRRIASRQLGRMRPGNTLQTTDLVHEAYLRLAAAAGRGWNDREHFYAVAARAMRQILVNHALARRATKRGGGNPATVLDENRIAAPEPEIRLLELNAALNRLEQLDPRLPRVVECRFFAGLTEQETAAALGVSERTVQRDWKLARGWLYEELSDADQSLQG